MARSRAILSLTGLFLLCSSGAALALVSAGPTNLSLPQITGTPEVGRTLTCSQGTWGGSVDTYAYQWNRNGAEVGSATVATYVVVDADVAQQITCTVTATGFGGSAAATSLPVVPTAAGGGGNTPSAPTTQSPLPDPAAVIEFPTQTKKRCASRRHFKIRIVQAPGIAFSSAAVFVNGKQVQVVTGSRLTAPVDLRGLPTGSFKAKIVVTTSDGRTLTGSRKYKTCAKKRGPKGKKHRL